MKTIHLILNAHIDPIWLWPWQDGLDAVLATCRSACDRLDTHPDLYFTRGEAWVYDQIERVDPALFARIRQHVRNRRWNIVGGWWIQPDCNLPAGFAMRKQIELGRRYFQRKFRTFPDIAYNVDSFGHAASLPGLMREAGQDKYVMMRPAKHEMSLAANLFRWRGYSDGPEVTVYRIPDYYNTNDADVSREHILAAVESLPPGINHGMCFIGVGDHGGGPTEAQIASLRTQWNDFKGIRLEFSTPRRFFAAVAKRHDKLPLVVGELQHHAIGCYSVYRPAKVQAGRSANLLAQAAVAIECDPAAPKNAAQAIEDAWKDVCFNHFHDTLGGTSIPSAYPQALDQLGRAAAVADELIHHSLRRQILTLPPDPLQRLALFNASDRPCVGYICPEPWLDYKFPLPTTRLLDDSGNALPFQQVEPEAIVQPLNLSAFLFKIAMAPRELKVIRIDKTGAPTPPPGAPARVEGITLFNALGVSVSDHLRFPAGLLDLPRLEMIPDHSDTWTHVVDRYAGAPATPAVLDAPRVLANGPLLASFMQSGKLGESKVRLQWRVYHDELFVELRLRVQFSDPHALIKLTLPMPSPAIARTDGIMAGHLRRECDGKERPLRDWSIVHLADGLQIGIICPDVFALDGTADRLRLTLLRSPLMAHHDPMPAEDWRGTPADQGINDFRLWFTLGSELNLDEIERRVNLVHRKPITANLTIGMPAMM
ncbi:MAG TPA: glycoside hydrolase family 38 C-terminal domain-containing protein [Tepidisphaeraceae bacterium]|jgi:alpha-mannosidase|nr:glycoside hydrolase family 38 C-terminal domain-containing protein [Tepidisphaeraceae bacterium]